MTFERTHEYELVRRILTDPGIYRRMGEDGLPPPDEFEVNRDPRIWYVVAFDEGGLLGLFAFLPDTSICWQVHAALLRGIPPRVTHQVGREILPWIWSHTPCERVIARVPEINRAAVRFGQQAMGLIVHGFDPQSFCWGGRKVGRVLMGLSKP
jgi:hypothetical protein